MVYFLTMDLDGWGDPLQAGALLPRPHHLSNFDPTLGTSEFTIILFAHFQPGWTLDEERCALLSVQDGVEQSGPARAAAIVCCWFVGFVHDKL